MKISINPLKIAALGDIDALHIILVTPKIQILTKDSRAVLPGSIPMKAFIRNLANTASITAAFTNNDYTLLKDNLQDDAIEPHRSKLIPGFYNAKEAAINAGADGLCISGAGPTVFAITNKEEQRDIGFSHEQKLGQLRHHDSTKGVSLLQLQSCWEREPRHISVILF